MPSNVYEEQVLSESSDHIADEVKNDGEIGIQSLQLAQTEDLEPETFTPLIDESDVEIEHANVIST